jgi:creatinine amidohydrolase
VSGSTREAVPGLALLEARARSLPEAIREAASTPLPDLAPPESVRRCLTTGVGSSAAHARFLACVLEEHGLPARFVPVGWLAGGGAPTADALLVVFSQGWSATARGALAAPHRCCAAVLVTAVAEGASPEDKVDEIQELAERGVGVVRVPGAEEYGTLVRLIGPMTGYVAALRIAQAVAPAGSGLRFDPTRVSERVAAIAAGSGRSVPELAPEIFDGPLGLVARGAYVECIENLAEKVLEGMLRPRPPIWEILEIAHGPLQQAHAGRATFLAATRGAVAAEEDLLSRLERCLDPRRHRLVRLAAAATGFEAIFEHEALMNTALLGFVRERRVDQVDWPGRGADAPLYDQILRGPSASAASSAEPSPTPALADLTWPDIAAAVASGKRTAVLALGSTEQHGPHLPFDTDTRIAAALARRFCARVPEAVALPPLALGSAREHASFPGTLSLDDATLEAVLVDLARSVARSGFAHLFVFSAHGGNEQLLERVAPALAVAAAPTRVIVHAALARTTALLHGRAGTRGVSAAEAGHHAGEVETSMMLQLAPERVRRDRLVAGRLDVPEPASQLFYPSLRENAPDGTVGDPRRASAASGRAYLAAWTDDLVAAYREAIAGELAREG